MTEGRDGRAVWSDVRTKAIDGRGIRVKDILVENNSETQENKIGK